MTLYHVKDNESISLNHITLEKDNIPEEKKHSLLKK
jgi:hypothetical protein